MNARPIAYLEPLEKAWDRMKELLFRPFDLTRWLVIGFSAWLATLGEQGGSFNFGDWPKHPSVKMFIREHWPLVITVGGIALVVFLMLGLVMLWLSARGKFMFLDNCLTGTAQISNPWRRWRQQGHALFMWLLVYGCSVLFICLIAGGLCVALAWSDIRAKMWGWHAIAGIALGGFFLLLLSLAAGYIQVFLEDFVVVLMRRHELKTRAAWKLFGRLFRAQPGPFLLYGLLRFAISLLMAMTVVLAGCLTCCCGFLILALPYVGTVLLLPLLVWQRYWGIEFLRQFGPAYDAWLEEPPALPPPVATPDIAPP